MKVSCRNRDRLAAIAAAELPGTTLDNALEVLLFEHESRAAISRLTPEQLADWQNEALALAETDVQVSSEW